MDSSNSMSVLILILFVPQRRAESVSVEFREAGIVPDLLDFPPTKELMVKFNGEQLSIGQTLTLEQVKIAPNKVRWPSKPQSDKYYTLLLLDGDPANPGLRSILHWLLVNIYALTSVTKVKYIRPQPKEGSGPHRYVFLLFEQRKKLDFKANFTTPESRTKFSMREFIKEYKLVHTPIAGNYFRAENQAKIAARAKGSDILGNLRVAMRNAGVVAYIIPDRDAHNNEVIRDCDMRVSYVSKFDGTSGTAVVTLDKALLWTDGRYFIQAKEQLDNNWTLMKDGLPDTPTIGAWLSKNLPAGSAVGVDPTLLKEGEWGPLSTELQNNGKALVGVTPNLVDLIWPNRPPCRSRGIFEHSLEFSGKRTREKVLEVWKAISNAGCEFVLVTELDQIAWLLNFRGSDFEYSPLFLAYVLLSTTGMDIFIDLTKLTPTIRTYLQKEVDNLAFFPYESALDLFHEKVKSSTGRVYVSNTCSHAFATLVPEGRRILKPTPIAIRQALKNPVEVKGMQNAHVRDGVAVCEFLTWLERQIVSGKKVTEISAAEKLLSFRTKKQLYFGLSFETISASGPNSAMAEYIPKPSTDRKLTTSEMYVIDSGAQYLDGTTDVTRTLHFGTPTDFQRDCFTRVLKGQIALKSAIFPNKVVGFALDALARKALWDVGLDYMHGTGHCIGQFLNVHEGPQGIGSRYNPDDPGLQQNMFVSDEPGFYLENQFGIRLENVLRVVPANGLANNFRNRGYLTFEDVTFVPIQRKLIKIELLTPAEIKCINDYHKEVRRKIGGFITKNNLDKRVLAWVLKETGPLRVVHPLFSHFNQSSLFE